jgi:hypothetical protein
MIFCLEKRLDVGVFVRRRVEDGGGGRETRLRKFRNPWIMS